MMVELTRATILWPWQPVRAKSAARQQTTRACARGRFVRFKAVDSPSRKNKKVRSGLVQISPIGDRDSDLFTPDAQSEQRFHLALGEPGGARNGDRGLACIGKVIDFLAAGITRRGRVGIEFAVGIFGRCDGNSLR